VVAENGNVYYYTGGKRKGRFWRKSESPVDRAPESFVSPTVSGTTRKTKQTDAGKRALRSVTANLAARTRCRNEASVVTQSVDTNVFDIICSRNESHRANTHTTPVLLLRAVAPVNLAHPLDYYSFARPNRCQTRYRIRLAKK